MEDEAIYIGGYYLYGSETHQGGFDIYVVTYLNCITSKISITSCLQVFDWGDTFK
jgi:hypothetical protein